MADQGLLGQAKPAGTTNTVLYSAPVDQSASAVLTIANDGTGAAYDVALKDFDQNLVLDASTYNPDTDQDTVVDAGLYINVE